MKHKIDDYSYHVGIIDAFNEMISTQVKKLALSHTFDSKEKRDEFIYISKEIGLQYHTQFYIEDDLLISDLFPVTICKNKHLILYYKDRDVLDTYLNLKKKKQEAIKNEMYDDLRYEIAYEFGELLSYPKEVICKLIEKNDDRE